MTKQKHSKAEKSSGNIFADLGLPHPEQEQLKARLTLQIYQIIKERGLTQKQAAAMLGLKQPHVSLLMRNRSGTFSVGKLMELLTKLDQDVQITPSAPNEAGRRKCLLWSVKRPSSDDGICKMEIAAALVALIFISTLAACVIDTLRWSK